MILETNCSCFERFESLTDNNGVAARCSMSVHVQVSSEEVLAGLKTLREVHRAVWIKVDGGD